MKGNFSQIYRRFQPNYRALSGLRLPLTAQSTPVPTPDARGDIMDRRTFLKSAASAGALVTAGGLATPAISQRIAARALRLIPHTDLANFDPVWSGAYIVRNAGLLVWDMLY